MWVPFDPSVTSSNTKSLSLSSHRNLPKEPFPERNPTLKAVERAGGKKKKKCHVSKETMADRTEPRVKCCWTHLLLGSLARCFTEGTLNGPAKWALMWEQILYSAAGVCAFWMLFDTRSLKCQAAHHPAVRRPFCETRRPRCVLLFFEKWGLCSSVCDGVVAIALIGFILCAVVECNQTLRSFYQHVL